MRLRDVMLRVISVLLPVTAVSPAFASDVGGYNLVGTWKCHNPVIVQDHAVLAENVTYDLVVFKQIHQSFFGHYELDLAELGLDPDGIQSMKLSLENIKGIAIREAADGQTILRSNLTGVIGPKPDQFYAIDHLPDAFKVGIIDSSEHFSYVVMGLGAHASAHNGYCIRISRDTPQL